MPVLLKSSLSTEAGETNLTLPTTKVSSSPSGKALIFMGVTSAALTAPMRQEHIIPTHRMIMDITTGSTAQVAFELHKLRNSELDLAIIRLILRQLKLDLL